MTKLYKKLQKLLAERNMTAYRLSVETGITQAAISSWKSGRCKPNLDNIVKLAEYFGVSVNYFLNDAT